MAYTDIDKPDLYFNTKLWTGDGNTTQAITGVGFQPDLVWEKGRNLTSSNLFFDAIRGANVALVANSTNAEVSVSGYINSFDSDGFTVGNDGAVNGSGDQYVSWNWLASNTTASNTDGSITSTVSANTTSGFSIVSYTGTGSAGTIGHSLGVSPSMIIFKCRDNIEDWGVYHKSLGATQYLRFNKTDSVATATSPFNDTEPTSSVFSVGFWGSTNGNIGSNYIAYCFAEKKGFSKAFSYTGNGSSNGSYIHLGMKPAMIIVKRTDSADDWVIVDNKRVGYNPDTRFLYPNSSSIEDTLSDRFDILSTGFKLRNSWSKINASGGNYIGIAFAENPFTTSTGIPTTAR